MTKLEKHGYRKWWPMKEHTGKDKSGKTVGNEVYRNMVTGEVHHPVDRDGKYIGWNGSPPDLPNGDKSEVNAISNQYRDNYDNIKWNK